MKKYLSLTIFIMAIVFVLASCKKQDHKTQYITLNESVTSGSMYKLSLSAYGDADDEPAITTQAVNYTVSQLSKDAATANNTYSFSVNQKIADKETVVITLKENHNGRGNCNRNEAEAVITINFTIN